MHSSVVRAAAPHPTALTLSRFVRRHIEDTIRRCPCVRRAISACSAGLYVHGAQGGQGYHRDGVLSIPLVRLQRVSKYVRVLELLLGRMYVSVSLHVPRPASALLGLVAMVLYMVITVSAGDPHTRYGPGFAFAVLSWILALGNFLCASVISPGLRQSCACCSGQTLERGDDLLTEDERDAYLPSNTPPSSPPNPVRSPRQGSLQVERAPLAGAV